MSDEEAARIQRIRLPEKSALKAQHLAGRRAGLAGLLGVAAHEVNIAHDGEGRPYLPDQPDLSVSFSDSHGWNALALHRGPTVGIDIELVRQIEWAPMLAMICQPEEADMLRGILQAANSLTPFFRAWTAKEAVLKAAGTGLQGGAARVRLSSDFLSGAKELSETELDGITYRLETAHPGAVIVTRAVPA